MTSEGASERAKHVTGRITLVGLLVALTIQFGCQSPNQPTVVVNTLEVFHTTSNVLTAVGVTTQMNAIATFSDATTANVTMDCVWRSSRPDVATVSATGLVRAVAEGSTVITARFGIRTGEAGINVDLP